MNRILLVEDDHHIQILVKAELAESGYSVTGVLDGKEAITLLKKEQFDCCILDLRMPNMDGLETMGHIIKLRLSMPIIIYSAYTGYKDDCLADAADAYVVKSHDMSELTATVLRLSPLPISIARPPLRRSALP